MPRLWTLFAQLERDEKDARALAGYVLVCETKDAQRALRERGMRPDAAQTQWPSARLCREGGDGLPVWRVKLPETMDQPKVDFVALPTLRSVEIFKSLSDGWDLSGLTAVCIGQRTAEAAGKLGLQTVCAGEASLESMAKAME